MRYADMTTEQRKAYNHRRYERDRAKQLASVKARYQAMVSTPEGRDKYNTYINQWRQRQRMAAI